MKIGFWGKKEEEIEEINIPLINASMRLTASMAVSNKASTIALPGLRFPCRPRRATLGGRGRLSALLRPPRGAAAQGQVDRVHAPRRQAHGRVRQQRRDGGGQREVRRRRRGGLQDAPPHLGQVSEHFVDVTYIWNELGSVSQEKKILA